MNFNKDERVNIEINLENFVPKLEFVRAFCHAYEDVAIVRLLLRKIKIVNFNSKNRALFSKLNTDCMIVEKILKLTLCKF